MPAVYHRRPSSGDQWWRETLECSWNVSQIWLAGREGSQDSQQCVSQVSRAFHYTDQKTFVKVYKSLSSTSSGICCVGWSPWTKQSQMSLRRCRKELWDGARALSQRRDKMDIAEMYTIKTRTLTVDPRTRFEKACTDETGGQSSECRDSGHSTRLEKKLFRYSCVRKKNWPNEIKKSVNVRSFKANYRDTGEETQGKPLIQAIDRLLHDVSKWTGQYWTRCCRYVTFL